MFVNESKHAHTTFASLLLTLTNVGVDLGQKAIDYGAALAGEEDEEVIRRWLKSYENEVNSFKSFALHSESECLDSHTMPIARNHN